MFTRLHDDLMMSFRPVLSIARASFVVILIVTFTGCDREVIEDPATETVAADSGLRSLLLQGHELHDSIHTQAIGSIRDLPHGMPFQSNPQLSLESEFVEATARGGSQGRLDGSGMRAALYARYLSGESEIGFYGLEAESMVEADRREAELREIWAYGASLDRASVFRHGTITVVVWLRTDEPASESWDPECWESVKSKVEQQLRQSDRS